MKSANEFPPRMSPPGRPKGEYRSAEHEGSPVGRLLRTLSAVGVLWLCTGCDESAQGGIGASPTLPSIVTNFGAENVDIGVGNVNWVGNPRW